MRASHQSGQALLPMLAFIIILAIATVYLFNTSQVLAERTQAKVLADHAAYNTAVKQAQLLNANAYMNKAKMANQLAVAQAVSVASWAKHFEPMAQNSGALNAIPVVGSTLYEGISVASQSIQPLAEIQDIFVTANGMATKNISLQQNILNKSSLITIAQQPDLVIKNSSIGNNFQATPLKLSSQFAVDPLNKDFIARYQGDSIDPYEGRSRMKDILLAERDSFTSTRRSSTKSINLRAAFPSISIERRGGTELSNDLNQWKGADSLSYYYYKWSRYRYKKTESAIGYGSAVARDEGDADASNAAGYDGIRTNAQASGRTSWVTPTWDSRNGGLSGEYGVPEYWDLSKDFLTQDNPSMNVAIKISKGSDKLSTTTGMSNFKVGKKIDINSSDNITAISTAQVYFERPLQDKQGKSTFLNSGSYEKGSLFNPYWTVKLTDNSTESIAEANIP